MTSRYTTVATIILITSLPSLGIEPDEESSRQSDGTQRADIKLDRQFLSFADDVKARILNIETPQLVLGNSYQLPVSIKNKGKVAFPIERASTTCGCVSARVPQRTIRPGEEAKAFIMIRPEKKGHSTSRITLLPAAYNEKSPSDGRTPLYISVRTNAQPPIQFLPSVLTFKPGVGHVETQVNFIGDATKYLHKRPQIFPKELTLSVTPDKQHRDRADLRISAASNWHKTQPPSVSGLVRFLTKDQSFETPFVIQISDRYVLRPSKLVFRGNKESSYRCQLTVVGAVAETDVNEGITLTSSDTSDDVGKSLNVSGKLVSRGVVLIKAKWTGKPPTSDSFQLSLTIGSKRIGDIQAVWIQ